MRERHPLARRREQRTWRSFLDRQPAAVRPIERQLQQDAGLPHAYYEILVRLSEGPAALCG